MVLNMCLQKIFGEKIGLLLLNSVILCKILITTFIFEENRQFLRQKLAQNRKSSDNNVCPWH
jgi:hypothetical protein